MTESQVPVQPRTQVVAIQAVGIAAFTHQALLDGHGQGRLPDPDSPVNQTVAPLAPNLSTRSCRLTVPGCQVTLDDVMRTRRSIGSEKHAGADGDIVCPRRPG